MALYIFAHRGEAQTFIKNLRATALDKDLYQFNNGLIYICSEGIYDVMCRLGSLLDKYQVSKVINYGIAGALNNKLKINQVYSIRSIYLENNNEIEFKSITLNGDTDCITANKRVLDESHKNKLLPIADIVDREIWGIAKVCQAYNIELQSYKLISDFAGASTDCFDLKNTAQLFSDLMWNHFQARENLATNENNSRMIQSNEIPWDGTQYQKNILDKLMKKIDKNQLETFIQSINDQNLAEKEKINLLIEKINNKLYPVQAKIKEKLKRETKVLSDNGFQVIYDQKLEKKKIKLNLEVNSQKNISDAISALEKFNYQSFNEIFEGNFDV